MFRDSNTCALQTSQIPSPRPQQFHARHSTPGTKKWDRHSCPSHPFPFAVYADSKHKERPDSTGAPLARLRKSFLLRSHVRHILRERILLVFAERPGGLEMIVVNKRVRRVMHVPAVGALQVRDAFQIELERLRFRRVRSSHRRLVAGHAVVRQLDLIAVQIVKRDHFHRLAVFFHAEFFHHRRSAGSQLQVQRCLVHVRFVGFPVAYESFQLLKRFRSAARPRLRHHRQDCHAQHQRTKYLQQAFHRSFSSHEIVQHKRQDHSKLSAQRAVAAGSAFLPKRCVANPTIAPRSMPGTMMSQNKAIPARSTTSRLNTAAIPMPARIPTTIECTRCETYPVVIPATNPFKSENVMTLPITGASDGSKKPPNPSINPSTPPTARPSMGFVRLIPSSWASAVRSIAASLGILVRQYSSSSYRAAVAAAGVAPYRCVAYPTIIPTMLPGIMIRT